MAALAGSAAAVAETMQALAAPSSLLMLARLRRAPCSVTTLAADVGMAQSAVSHQLRLLRHLGLVTATRQGKTTIYALYDDNNLYVAVDVTDDIIICDGPVPYLDDDAEIMIDGDRQPGDVQMALLCGPENPNCPNPVVNNEGFKLTTSVCNQSLTDPSNNPSIVWDSKAGLRPHGFVIEFRIPLSSINTIDTSWFSNPYPGFGFRPPQTGDIIGFNVAVGDDDNGGLSYLRSEPAPHTDSFTAWDGRSVGWYVFAERDWGNLYLAPRTDD